jgi:hypothetical protein
MSFAGTVRITDIGLDIKHLYLGLLISIHIGKNEIESIKFHADNNDLIETNFRRAKINKFMRFLLKSAPTGKILLNLGNDKDEFMKETKQWHPPNKAL